MAKNPFIKIGSLLMTAVLSVSMLSVAGFPVLKTKAEEAQPTVFTADFSSLPNGAVDDNDTSTVAYLKERFSFYFYQHLPQWSYNDGKPLMYYFERSNVNGYLQDDNGQAWRFPDTAGAVHHVLDGQTSTAGHDTVLNFGGYMWDQIPTWTIDDEWIYCTAYSGENATSFRQANLMYIRGNTENTLANIKNFDLQMDLMFRPTDGETIVEGKDAFAVIFDGATAGNANTDKQLMFAFTPDGKYLLGKPTERYATECTEQFTNANGNVTFERNKKYHLSMRHIGNTVAIKISDTDGNVLVQHDATVPTVLSGVGGNMAIGGSNAGAKYANIMLTRLDDTAQAYDFDNNANNYQFGVTARENVNWTNSYWSGWEYAENAVFMRNGDALSWSNKYLGGEARLFFPAEDNWRYDYNWGPSLMTIVSKMDTKFNVYHDAVKDGNHYFAKAPRFNSHHDQSGISNSFFGMMYLSANDAQSVALMAYLGQGGNPTALTEQSISLVPKTADGTEVHTKNFRTQFTVRLPENDKSAIALSFRSKAAGATVGEIGHGYADKTTLLLSGKGYYLDDGNGDLVQNGTTVAWNGWNDTGFTGGDATVYAEVVGTKLKLRVVAASGNVLLDDTLTIPDGDSGYLYYSAMESFGYFYSLFCDRLDEKGNVIEWDGHKLDKTEKKDATHFADGNIEYYTCSVCGKFFSDADGKNEITQAQTVIDKIAHTYGDYQHDENGHWKECSCGDRTAEGAHTGGTATCNKQAECTVCDAKYGAVDKTQHGETEVRDARKATCAADGYTGDTYCKDCGDKLATGTVIPAAHDLNKVEAKAATCTAEGNIEYYRCSVCGKLFSDANGTQEIAAADTVIPAAHKLNKVEAKAATTENEGNIEYYTCADCGKLFADAEGKKELSASDVVIAKLPVEDKPNEDKPNPSDPGSNSDKSPTTGERFYPIALAVAAALAAVAVLIAALAKKKKGAASA